MDSELEIEGKKYFVLIVIGCYFLQIGSGTQIHNLQPKDTPIIPLVGVLGVIKT